MDSIAMILAANLCGVAAMYVVIARTLQRREDDQTSVSDDVDFEETAEDKAA